MGSFWQPGLWQEWVEDWYSQLFLITWEILEIFFRKVIRSLTMLMHGGFLLSSLLDGFLYFLSALRKEINLLLKDQEDFFQELLIELPTRKEVLKWTEIFLKVLRILIIQIIFICDYFSLDLMNLIDNDLKHLFNTKVISNLCYILQIF